MYVYMYTLFEMLRVSAVVIHSEAACFLEESYREPSACRIHTSRENDQQACHIFFSFSSSTHILSKQTGDESSRRRSAATVPMWRSAGVTAVPHSTEVQGARPVARARGGGGVGHDNDIDDDDGELTFLLCSVELSPTYAVVHGARRHGGGDGIRRGGYLRRLPSQGKSVEEVEGG